MTARLALAAIAPALLLAGCLSPAPGAPPVGPQAGTEGCRADPAPIEPGLGERCDWALGGEGTFLAIGFLVDAPTRFRVENEHRARWTETPAYFHFRLVSEVTGGLGLPGHLVFSGAETSCTGGTAAVPTCDAVAWDEPRGGDYTFTLPAGEYVLLYAFFGAEEARLDLRVHTDRPLQPFAVQRGDTSLARLEPHATLDGAVRGAWAAEHGQPAWLVVRGAGGVAIQNVTLRAGEDAARFAFEPGAGWRPQSGARPGGVESPNRAAPAGPVAVAANWTSVAERPPGFPVVGIVHAPFFVDAAGCLAPRGGAASNATAAACGG